MRDPIRRELGVMLAELESFRLEVVLVPCRREVNVGGCVRVAVSRNAAWYRAFCAAHGSDRVRRKLAFDTRIKRAHTLRVLGQLVAGGSRSKYAEELISIARARMAKAAKSVAIAA